MRRASIVILVASTLLGCRASIPSHIVVGPYRSMPPARLWEMTLEVVRNAHYRPEHVDPNLGRIVIPSRVYGSRQRIVIQLYREGWIQVGLFTNAPAVWTVYVPPEVEEEELELVTTLRDELTEPAEAERPRAADDERPPS